MTVAIEDLDVAELVMGEVRACADVTTLTGDRIRPDELAQGDVGDCLRYETLSVDEPWDLAARSEHATTRLQVDAYADTRRGANRLSAIAHAKIVSLAGRLLGPPDQKIRIWDIAPDTNYTRKDPGPPGSTSPRYRRVRDYVINHDEAIHSLVDED